VRTLTRLALMGLLVSGCVTTDLPTIIEGGPATVPSLPPPMEPDVPEPPGDARALDASGPLDLGVADARPPMLDQALIDMSQDDPGPFEGQCMDASTCPYDDVCFALFCVPPEWNCTCVHVRDGTVPDEECSFWGLLGVRNRVDPRAVNGQTYRQTAEEYGEQCASPQNGLGSPCSPDRNTCRSGSCGGDDRRTFCTRNCDAQRPCPPQFSCQPVNPTRTICVPP
jgi:hypothetical protein